MKLVIFTFFLFMIACTKNTGTSKTITSFIKFKMDGTQVEYAGSCDSSSSNFIVCAEKGSTISIDTPDVAYYIGGYDLQNDEGISFEIVTDSLVSATYDTLLFEALLYVQNKLYSSFYNYPHFVIHVTKNADGTISGSFSGKVYNHDIGTDALDSISISDGEFNNVQIMY